MLKAVSNQSDSPIKLGGVEIKSKEQSQIRESLITKDEIKTLKDEGLSIEFLSIIIVKRSKKKATSKNKKESLSSGKSNGR